MQHDAKRGVPMGAHVAQQVVVCLELQAYRETIASTLGKLRPDLRVVALAPEGVTCEVLGRARCLVVCSKLTLSIRDGADSWIVLYPDHTDEAAVGGRLGTRMIHHIEFSDLLSLLEEFAPASATI